MYPVKKVRITSPYGKRGFDGWHYGLDFGAETQGVSGDRIYSIEKGRVVVSKNNPGGYGEYIVIDHGDYCSLYAHLKARTIMVGKEVDKGEIIGFMGNTPTNRGLGVHLHLEVRKVPYGPDFWDKTVMYGKKTPIHCVNPEPYLIESDYKAIYEEVLKDYEALKEEAKSLAAKLAEIKNILEG